MSPYDSGTTAPYWTELRKRVTPAGRKRLIAWGAIGVTVALVLGLILAGRGGHGGPPVTAAPAMSVTAAHVTDQRLRTTVSGIGSIAAWEELTIAAEATGLRVDKVSAEEGDLVKAGQVLAVLDARVLSAQLRQAEARVVEAKSTLNVAQNNHRRASELVTQGFISSSALDDRASAAETGAARLAAAMASRDELAARMTQTKIVAPADGRISKRSILTGDVVNPGTEAFRLIRDDRLELNAQIPEADMVHIAPGQAARVIHDGSGPVTATVRLVSPVVDPKTRLGIVHLTLPANSGLRAGMYARCEITLTDAPVPAVPDEAVVWRGDGKAAVFVIGADGHVQARNVAIGVRQDGWIEIKSGLAPTDNIAAAGAGFLNDGDKVKIIPPSSRELPRE